MITLPGVDPWMMWAGFLLLVFLLLEIDLGILNRKDHVIEVKEALLWSAFWIALSLIFNGWLYWQFGSEVALEFFTGYVIEKSLSVDNLFVFLMIFTAFSIPRLYQHRVLFWGILGAIVMRGVFIGLGAALVERFQWIFFAFALIILYGAYRMQFDKEEEFDPDKSVVVRWVRKIFPVSNRLEGHSFFVKENGKRAVTILFVALVVIELTDVVFATDSIPAIFAITTDPFIVFTSNIFAILGLRALYFALAGVHAMFQYLKTGLAFILAFIGVKMLIIGAPPLLDALGMDGVAHALEGLHIPTAVSLGVIVAILAISIIASLLKNRSDVRHGRTAERMDAAHLAGRSLGGKVSGGARKDEK